MLWILLGLKHTWDMWIYYKLLTSTTGLFGVVVGGVDDDGSSSFFVFHWCIHELACPI